MMNEKEESPQPRPRKRGGRSPKTNPAVFRYTVNFDAVEHARFLTLFEQSGLRSMAQFIAARVFSEEFRVVRTDRATLEYVTRLTELYQQFRAVGVNYNQAVKELHVHFSEKKALAMLYKLERATMELIGLSRKIVELTNTFESQWLRK
ncbi:MobA protein [Bacteroides fragilis]|nr:MobA protein [Bacteroides fragilis]